LAWHPLALQVIIPLIHRGGSLASVGVSLGSAAFVMGIGLVVFVVFVSVFSI